MVTYEDYMETKAERMECEALTPEWRDLNNKLENQMYLGLHEGNEMIAEEVLDETMEMIDECFDDDTIQWRISLLESCGFERQACTAKAYFGE